MRDAISVQPGCDLIKHFYCRFLSKICNFCTIHLRKNAYRYFQYFAMLPTNPKIYFHSLRGRHFVSRRRPLFERCCEVALQPRSTTNFLCFSHMLCEQGKQVSNFSNLNRRHFVSRVFFAQTKKVPLSNRSRSFSLIKRDRHHSHTQTIRFNIQGVLYVIWTQIRCKK